jgi:hypothetical protein
LILNTSLPFSFILFLFLSYLLRVWHERVTTQTRKVVVPYYNSDFQSSHWSFSQKSKSHNSKNNTSRFPGSVVFCSYVAYVLGAPIYIKSNLLIEYKLEVSVSSLSNIFH